MNIAFVHGIFPAGGAERVTMDIARYLVNKDYKIYVFCTKINELLYREEMGAYVSLKLIPRSGKQMRRVVEALILSLDIDILVKVAVECRGLRHIGRRVSVKTIFANHGEPFWQRYVIMSHRQDSWFKRILWRLYWHNVYPDDKGRKAMRMAIKRSRKIYDNNDVYTVLCEAYKTQTCEEFGVDPSESHVVAIENAEPIRDKVNYDKENIILYCGRLQRMDKRVDRLLRIWAMAQHQLPDWKLVIVGDGDDKENLQRMSCEQRLERIFFEGERYDVQSYYDRASILVLTSQTEGWPLCLTEAQASGVIPIAFGCSAAVRTILSPEGIHGFTVPCFNEEEYARKLVHVARLSEEEKQTIRHASVVYRAQCAPEIIARKWKALFDELVLTGNC